MEVLSNTTLVTLAAGARPRKHQPSGVGDVGYIIAAVLVVAFGRVGGQFGRTEMYILVLNRADAALVGDLDARLY